MHIAIIGTGRMAAALGRGWAERGHMITFGSRQPDSDKATRLRQEMPATVSVRGVRQSAEHVSIIVLALPYSGVVETVAQLGDLTGKIIIDCTNPIAPGLRSLVDHTRSGAQQVALLAPGAKVVKAFNSIGAEGMVDTTFNGRPATMFYCGDDALAKQAVRQLAADLGFEPVDAGQLSAARHLEALALLWIHLATATDLGREIAFRLEQRTP